MDFHSTLSPSLIDFNVQLYINILNGHRSFEHSQVTPEKTSNRVAMSNRLLKQMRFELLPEEGNRCYIAHIVLKIIPNFSSIESKTK